MEFIEQCRVSNGKGGRRAPGPVQSGGGHVILPRNVTVAKVKLKAMEKDARKRLQEANVELCVFDVFSMMCS